VIEDVVETAADDDSLELGNEFVAEVSEDENADEDLVLDAGDAANEDDLLELGDAHVAAADEEQQADVTPAPDRAAPRISTGGTLFERMSNLSRGLTRADEDEPDDKDGGGAGGLNIPRFLDRQSNN
jgi:cell division protein FtsZ